jgi:hypothetical protein
VWSRRRSVAFSIESAFTVLKPGLTGALHKASLKHLQSYLNEFSFQFNNREAPDLFGMTVRGIAMDGNMPYAKLVDENVFTGFVQSLREP